MMTDRVISTLYATGVYDGSPYPRTMSDAISLGVRAFEDIRCPMSKPTGCIFNGGRIEYDRKGGAMCALCGAEAKLTVLESSPEKTAQGEFIGKTPISKTGAKRGREDAYRKLLGGNVWNKAMQASQWEEGLASKIGLSATAQAEARRVFDEMLELGFHKGGTGLDALVHASAYFGARYDYNFITMEKIVGADSTSRKKARRIVKRARREKIVKAVVASAEEVLDKTFSKHPQTTVVQEVARKYARLQIPGLRPQIHAAGALYMALREVGSSKEKRTSQAQVGDDFLMTRKSVGQGYRAIKKAHNPSLAPRRNPPKKEGLTASQVRLLRRLR